MICPRCEGQRYDVGSCSLCGNTGVLDENAEKMEERRSELFWAFVREAVNQGLTGRDARRWAARKARTL